MENIVSASIKAISYQQKVNNLCSKVEGRRNWIIRTELNSNGEMKIVYKGGYGEGRRRNVDSEYLWYMAKYNVSWVYFTYKKDYIKALEYLADLGIE